MIAVALLAALAVAHAGHHGHGHHGMHHRGHFGPEAAAPRILAVPGATTEISSLEVKTADEALVATPTTTTTMAAAAAVDGDSPADMKAQMATMNARIKQLEGVIAKFQDNKPPPPGFFPNFRLDRHGKVGFHFGKDGPGGPPPPPPFLRHFGGRDGHGHFRWHHRHHGPHPVLCVLFLSLLFFTAYKLVKCCVRGSCTADSADADAGVATYPAYAARPAVANPYVGVPTAGASQVLPAPVPAAAVPVPAANAHELQHGIVLGTPVAFAQQHQ